MASQILLQNLLGNEYNFQEIIKALQKGEDERTDEDILQLMRITQVFFKDKGDTEQFEITKNLHFEHFKKDEVVFEYGSQGDKYYLLIRGEVAVMLPCKKQADALMIYEQCLYENKSSPLLVKGMSQGIRNSGTVGSQNKNDFQKSLFSTEIPGKLDLETVHETQITSNPDLQIMSNRHSILNNQDSLRSSKNSIFINETSQIEKIKLGITHVAIQKAPVKFGRIFMNQNNQSIFKHDNKTYFYSKNNTLKTMFEEMAVLKSGQSFGELALIQNKPRSATILCLTDCYLATLNKQSFNQAISKGMQKALSDNIEFLKSIPFFQGWTKNTLTKFLLHSVELQKTVRNQVICKENDSLNYVYFVKSGEFKAIQKQDKLEEKDDFVRKILTKKNNLNQETGRLMDPYKIQEFSNAKSLQNQLITSTNKEVCRYGSGQIFGEWEFLRKDNAQCTVVCDSQQGELLCVKVSEFQKKARTNDAGYRALIFNAENKSSKIAKLQQITKELEKDRQMQSQEKLNGRIDQMKNILVNRGEQDFRATLGEIVKKYPFVKRQKAKIIEIEKSEQNFQLKKLNYKSQQSSPIRRLKQNQQILIANQHNQIHGVKNMINFDQLMDHENLNSDESKNIKSQVKIPKAPRATSLAKEFQEISQLQINKDHQYSNRKDQEFQGKSVWITRKTLKACFSDRQPPTLESIVYDQIKREKKCYMSSKLDFAVLDQYVNQAVDQSQTSKHNNMFNQSQRNIFKLSEKNQQLNNSDWQNKTHLDISKISSFTSFKNHQISQLPQVMGATPKNNDNQNKTSMLLVNNYQKQFQSQNNSPKFSNSQILKGNYQLIAKIKKSRQTSQVRNQSVILQRPGLVLNTQLYQDNKFMKVASQFNSPRLTGEIF
eukprot:403368072